MIILGIESTCDETAAALVEDGRHLLSNVISTSVKEQALYGGVVPEIASRRHCEFISATVKKALLDAGKTIDDVDAVAVTFAPGLIGAVLVGVNFAKGLAYSAGKPLVPVHHLRGHIAALYLTHPELKPPFLCLVASGGHSHIVEVQDYTHYHILGHTVDDAAGEAFDKVARTLGLPYPGGPSVAAAAKAGDPKAYRLPVPHVEGKYNVSFSGLKTAVLNEVNKAQMKGEEVNVPDLAASFQERIAGILAEKLLLAAADTGAKQVCLAGGVAANGRLRQLVNDGAQKLGAKVYLPELKFCGDNGAMIAAQGYTFNSMFENQNMVGDSTAVSGFLGALFAGFAAGLIVNLLKKVFSWLPKAMDGIKPVFLYPLFGTFLVGALMCLINPAIGFLNTAVSNGLSSLGETSQILLSIVLAAMMATDMGGPFNKAAYVFGTAAIADGNTWIMAAVMIGGMVPPIAIALSTTFAKKFWTEEEIKSGPVNYLMGLCFITEGAIPYAASDPLRVIPSCMVGSALAGALTAVFHVTCPAPHGGIFTFAVCDHPLLYIVALVAGSLLGGVVLTLLKALTSKKKA